MNKVLVTGKNGSISTAISDWLTNEHGVSSERISLRGSGWEERNFNEFDVAVHVAGIVPKDGVNPEDFYEINYKLTDKFARKVKNDGVKHFIYISSMAVYGIEPQMSVEKGTVTEQTPCVPVTDYGKSKLLAEESLKKLEDEHFKVTIIRVPSIYGKNKTEYFAQYEHLATKFGKIPKAFTGYYKSIIYIDNLCELIYLIMANGRGGVICPDDGEISAVDICKAVAPCQKVSKVLGFVLSLFKKSDRIRDYFGAVCYSKNLTDVFEGKYRVCGYKEAIKKSYEH